jgi:predicted DNA-binding transcriptional regulator AlpA
MDETLVNARLLRLSSILAPKGPIPVSKSTWWKKVRSGEFPPAVRLGPRTTSWKESDIIALIKRFEEDK